jgi:hypothetical protein
VVEPSGEPARVDARFAAIVRFCDLDGPVRNGRSTRSIAVVALSFALSASAARGDPLADVASGLRGELDPRAADAFDRIDGTGRKLLAARSYLRAGRGLSRRWSWSDEEIDVYEKSDEYKAATDEVDKVIAVFEESNPGYTLYVNRKTRSLDAQISAWNENGSVGASAAALEAAAETELAKSPAGATPGARAIQRFRAFLLAWRPSPTPSLAAPGLSAHGQLRAFDFQVQEKVGSIVASTSTGAAEEEWDGPGWTVKLKQAVEKASTRFKGPLESPREPWHYDYEP